MHVYVLEHIVSLSYRTDRWKFTKLGMDEVRMIHDKCCCFWPDPSRCRSRVWQKKRHGGPLLQTTFSSDRKATASNHMHSNDLEACGMKCFYFWFHSEVQFLMRFDVLFDLVILPYFYAAFL